MLMEPSTSWAVAALCRRSDPDRRPKFFRALEALSASGNIGDLNDGPEQQPVTGTEIENVILTLLPHSSYDLILTHSPLGEYTRHRRHEETGRAILGLWKSGVVNANRLLFFAYHDGKGKHLPHAIEEAHRTSVLPDSVWREKYRIVTEVYGFTPDSWEARTTPRQESFWQFANPDEAERWLHEQRQSAAELGGRNI